MTNAERMSGSGNLNLKIQIYFMIDTVMELSVTSSLPASIVRGSSQKRIFYQPLMLRQILSDQVGQRKHLAYYVPQTV